MRRGGSTIAALSCLLWLAACDPFVVTLDAAPADASSPGAPDAAPLDAAVADACDDAGPAGDLRHQCAVGRDCDTGRCTLGRCIAPIAFNANKHLTLPPGCTHLVPGDFDGDGAIDLTALCTGQGGAGTAIFIANRNARFFKSSDSSLTGITAVGGAAADIDLDGRADLLLAGAAGSLSVLRSRGDGTFDPPKLITLGANPTSLVVADLDGNGWPDAALAAPSGQVMLVMGRAAGVWDSARSVMVTGAPVAIGVSRLRRMPGHPNAPLDLITGNDSGSIGVLRGDGNGGFLPTQKLASLAGVVAVASADFNNDGLDDVAAISPSAMGTGARVTLLLNDGGLLSAASRREIDAELDGPLSLFTGDFDSDGAMDMLYLGSAIGRVDFLPGRGDGTFDYPVPITLEQVRGGLCRFDFDGDGDLDAIGLRGDDVLVMGNYTPRQP